MALKPPLQKYTMVESDFFQCHFRINRNAYPVLRPDAGSYVANLAAANTLFVTRLNDRAGETRYIDPVTEQGVQANFGYVKLAGIMPGVTATDS